MDVLIARPFERHRLPATKWLDAINGDILRHKRAAVRKAVGAVKFVSRRLFTDLHFAKDSFLIHQSRPHLYPPK